MNNNNGYLGNGYEGTDISPVELACWIDICGIYGCAIKFW